MSANHTPHGSHDCSTTWEELVLEPRCQVQSSMIESVKSAPPKKPGVIYAGQLPPLPPGTVVDHFQVVRCLGRGGMGVVYLARDTQLGRKVALKVIDPALARSPDAVSMFLREARATARFNHPHIVTIHGVGQHGVAPYIALEYLEGQTLRERLDEVGSRMGTKEAIRTGLAVAEALSEAHAHNIVHGDLKPDNVVIPQDGRPRVVDFGICRVMAAGDPEVSAPTEISRTSGSGGDPWDTTVVWIEPIERCGNGPRPALGTPAYMAPEQWLASRVDGAADIWALGLLLGDLLGNWHPYDELMDTDAPGASVKALRRAVLSDRPVPSLPASLADELPEQVLRVIVSCLQKDPERRPGAANLVESLRGFLDETMVSQTSSAPFPGLRPFVEEEARFFFGQETEVAAFVERVRTEAVLPVIGPSGVGKSSFVRAGVIPRLKEQGKWVVVELSPDADPFTTLADKMLAARRSPDHSDHGLWSELMASPAMLSLRLRALAREHECPVLLFVDQLEDVVAKVADPTVRRSFVESICSAADDREDPVRVIFTLRDDVLTHLASLSARAREVLGRVTVLAGPDATSLERIVTAPLEVVGFEYDDPQLTGEMVTTVLGEPNCLPLLQFATRMLWERRDRRNRTLQRSVYETFGGVAGALAAHADGVLEGLSPSQRWVTRNILLRLVSPEGTRQPVDRNELLEGLGTEADLVLGRLVAGRLVTVKQIEDGGVAEIELIHESLIHSWSRLSHWITEGQQDLRFLNDVTRAANLWLSRGARPDEVWRGDALRDAQRSLKRCTMPVPAQVGRFLDAGRRREWRRHRRRRGLQILLAALLTVAVGGGVFAVATVIDRGRKARREADHALRRWAEAQREGARAALARGDLLEARAKLRGSLEKGDSPAARVLWRRLQRHPLLWAKSLGTIIYDVSIAPDGTAVAAAAQDRSVYLADVRSGQLRRLAGHRDQVFAVAHSSDGSWLASASLDGEVRVWDRKGALVHRLDGPRAPLRSLVFRPRGREIAMAGVDGAVRLWAPGGGPAREIGTHRGGVEALDFAPDGKTLASGGTNGTVLVWSLDTGRSAAVARLKSAIYSVAFAPDGRLAVAAGDGRVWVWKLPGKRRRPTLSIGKLDRPVRSVRFSPDGRTIALASQGGGIRLYQARTGQPLQELPNVPGAISVSFGSRGLLLATGGVDQVLRLWNASRQKRTRAKVGAHQRGVNTVVFSPDGRYVASGSGDKTIRLWRVADGAPVRVLSGHRDIVYRVAFSPDGRRLASASWDETVRVWNVDSGEQRLVLDRHHSAVLDVAFNSDGRLVASGGRDGSAIIFNSRSGRVVRRLPKHRGPVMGVAFGPKNRVATTSYDYKLRLWELTVGSPSVTVDHRHRPYGVAFSSRGELATSGWDGAVRLWDPVSLSHRIVGRHPGRAYRVAFVPGDGPSRVGSVGADGSARIWSLALGGSDTVTFSRHNGEVNDLAFSPDGQLAATAGDDGTVRLWRTDTGAPVWGAARATRRAAKRLGRRTIAGHGWDAVETSGGGVEIRDPDGRRRLLLQETPSSQVTSLRAFHHDLVLVGFANGLVGLWSVRDGSCLERTWLHGPVWNLTVQGTELRAVSELGQKLAWDLTALRKPYCDLLWEVWSRVPVVWESGSAMARLPPSPSEHRCSAGIARRLAAWRR